MEAAGYLTAYSCEGPVPNASNLNFDRGQVVANLVIVGLSGSGDACIFVFGRADVIVDLSATVTTADFVPLRPARLMDTRTGTSTIDGRYLAGGLRAADSTTAVHVAGRAGLPANATSVVMNLTATEAPAQGFITAYMCGASVPATSSLNYAPGVTVANMAVVALNSGGDACFYAKSPTQLIIDVSGYFIGSTYHPVRPARLADSRPGASTVDGRAQGTGTQSTETTLTLSVGGRGAIPPRASAVVLNLTSVNASSGFLTAFAAGAKKPGTSNLNYAPWRAVANSAIVQLGAGGNVCLYSFGATDLIVDVVGWFEGPTVSQAGTSCAGPSPTTPTTSSTSAPTQGGVEMHPYAIPARGSMSAGSILRSPQSSVPYASGDGTGDFRLVCRYSHMAYDDPIVFPGRSGAAHLHSFFGNTGTSAMSTYDSLRTSGNSTCDGGIANRSAYWIPSLINNNVPVAPDLMFVYYKSGYRSVAPRAINNIPNGLRMIAGNAKANSAQSGEVVMWSCESGGSNQTVASIPSCSPGGQLRLSIVFPQCWNGRDLDSADHKSHMAYPTYGVGCPASHPVALPVITQNFLWNVPAGGTGDMFLVSDTMAGTTDGISAHADFMEAWDPTIRNTFTQNCIRAALECGVRPLGDGTELTYLNSLSGLPGA